MPLVAFIFRMEEEMPLSCCVIDPQDYPQVWCFTRGIMRHSIYVYDYDLLLWKNKKPEKEKYMQGEVLRKPNTSVQES